MHHCDMVILRAVKMLLIHARRTKARSLPVDAGVEVCYCIIHKSSGGVVHYVAECVRLSMIRHTVQLVQRRTNMFMFLEISFE
jgi:hypothetical protein